MPEANDHSRIEGKYNNWETIKDDNGLFHVILWAAESGTALLQSGPMETKEEAQDLVRRATSGNTMHRFTDTTF